MTNDIAAPTYLLSKLPITYTIGRYVCRLLAIGPGLWQASTSLSPTRVSPIDYCARYLSSVVENDLVPVTIYKLSRSRRGSRKKYAKKSLLIGSFGGDGNFPRNARGIRGDEIMGCTYISTLYLWNSLLPPPCLFETAQLHAR